MFYCSGKEVVQEVEQLQVDKKSRPLQDARILNCGELVPKSKVSIPERYCYWHTVPVPGIAVPSQ